jgi:hypothetical protein
MTPEPNIDVKAITIEFLEAQPIGARFTPMDIHRLVSFRSNGHRAHIKAKMRYNESRPYKHGKEY